MTESITFNVPGASCGHCEVAVQSEVAKVTGVASVVVDLAAKDVVVTGSGLVAADLVAAIDAAGYEVA